MKEIGFDVEISALEASVLLTKVFTDRDFDLTLQSFVSSGDPAIGYHRMYITTTGIGRMLPGVVIDRYGDACVVRPDGAPHLVPIWFWWDGEAVLVFSKPDAQKVRNLRIQPRVMLGRGLLVVFGWDYERIRTQHAQKPGLEQARHDHGEQSYGEADAGRPGVAPSAEGPEGKGSDGDQIPDGVTRLLDVHTAPHLLGPYEARPRALGRR